MNYSPLRSRSRKGSIPESDPSVVLPPDWYKYKVLKGVDRTKPGIYIWCIAGVGSYVGKFKRISRPTRHYTRNIRRLLNNLPYRRSNPTGFRNIHHKLAEAHLTKRAIKLIILENVPLPHINQRERELIAKHGSLNVPKLGRTRKRKRG